MKANPTIFLSYNRKNALDADQIDDDFKAVGINFRRDIRDIEYRANIKDFMNNIGESDFVLMLISDEFLKSDWCMYEVSELVNAHKFRDKILPIVLTNADSIFSAKSRISYYEYWEGRLKEDKRAATKYPNQDTVEVLNRTKNIESNLGTFFNEIAQLNLKAIENLKTENYSSILQLVGFDNQLITQEVLAIWQLTDPEEREIALINFGIKYPENENFYFLKGHLAQHEGKVKLAKLLYEKTIALNPKSANAYNNLGWIFQSSYSDYGGAKEMYENALMYDPNLVHAYNNMGSLLQEGFSDSKGAVEMYKQGVKLDPNFALTYYNWGRLLQNSLSDFNGAREKYEIVLELDPNNALTYNNLGVLYQNYFNDFNEAKRMFEKAISIDSKLILAYCNLGILLAKNMDEFDQGKAYYVKAKELANNQSSPELDSYFGVA